MSNVTNSASKEAFRSVIENGTDLVTITNPDGMTTYVSPQCQDVIGYEGKDMLGVSMPDFIHPDDKEMCNAEWQKVMTGKSLRGFEYRIIDNQGQIRWLSHSAKYVKVDKETVGLQSIIRNITERKKVEAEINQSRDEIDRILNLSSDIIGYGTLDGRFTKINSAVSTVLGYSESKFLQKVFLDFIHPDDIQATKGALRKAQEGVTELSIDNRYRCNDGTYKWISWSVVSDAANNEFLAIGRDITVRKEAEQTLQQKIIELNTFINNIPDMAWLKDVNSNFIAANNAFGNAVGMDPEYLVSNTCEICFGKEAAGKFKKDDKKVMESKKQFVFEEKIIDANKNEVWLETIKSPIIIENRKVTGTVGIARNITLRKKAEQEKEKLEEQLRQSEKMQAIGQLAGGVAHDFNNQLSGILNFAELAKNDVEENSTTALYINNIISGTLRSANLTKQLLAFARKGKCIVTTVDVNKTISEVVSMLTHSIDKKIKTMQHSNANPATISGDFSQIQNAILNIALNSRDAMPKGGELILSTDLVSFNDKCLEEKKHELKPGEYLRISITDNGIGMDTETQKHIFEPFFTTKEQGKGIGMGMASVYGTVKSHSGAIAVKSKPGEGTTITIFFPLTSTEKVKSEESNSKIKKTDGQILVVDDEEIVATSLRMTLVRDGYKGLSCKNGKEALKIFEESWKNIDLVILDMMMPDMDGKETFYALKKIDPDVRVLLLSGYSITEGTKELIKDGAMGFLQKPVKRIDLLTGIAEILNKKNVQKRGK